MKNKHVLITGGTGSFGRSFVEYILKRYPNIGSITVFSRDEQKHVEMSRNYPSSDYPVRYAVGDVRDRERIIKVAKGKDIIVHAAAIKHVPIAEAYPMECAKTNIMGVQNVVDAAMVNNVQKVICLSTDKAVLPSSVYGASKLFLEKIAVDADLYSDTRFTVVRYANVFGSNGSVVPYFIKKKVDGYLPITHPDMTRFSITMQEGLDLVMYAINNTRGGDIIVPKAPSYRIMDVARAIAPDVEHRIVGVRQGEKIHEVMIGSNESYNTVLLDDYYIICPTYGKWTKDKMCKETCAKPFESGNEYQSGSNDDWITVEKIRDMINDLDI